MSTVLTHLKLTIPRDTLTEEKSAALCQLKRLRRLELYFAVDPHAIAEDFLATIFLDLPLLAALEVIGFGPTQLTLKCPKLVGLVLQGVCLRSFCGMPSSIYGVALSLPKGSVPLKTIFPPGSAKLLGKLTIREDPEQVTDSETIRRLCLNGFLKHLTIKYEEVETECDGAAAGAFSVHAPWQLVPKTLQNVYLDLPLDKGIPRILEQLLSLRNLSLRHSKRTTRMHLDRPLEPFLAMPRLEELRMESRWQKGDVGGGGPLFNWSPIALRFLGLAEKRIKEMQLTTPRRSINLIY